MLKNLPEYNIKKSIKIKQQQMITFTEIVSCHGTALYEASNKQVSFHSSGTLSILIAYDGMILLKMDDFQYGVNSSDQMLYDDKDPQFSYIFYLRKYPEGQWVLKVNENGDSVFSCLNEKCYLKNKRGNDSVVRQYQADRAYSKVVEIKEEPMVSHQRKQQTKSETVEESEGEGWTAKQVVIGASKGLGTGLIYTGKFISKGLANLGGYISKNVNKNQDVKVGDGTKENIKLATKTTKNVLTFTSEQVGNLFKFGKNLAADIGERFEKSDNGKSMQENPYYDSVKEGAKTGAKVIGNLYDGVVTAVYEIGSGASKGTTQVIDAKYGKEAGQVADGVFEGTGNIAKIVRSPYDQAAKAFKSDEKE